MHNISVQNSIVMMGRRIITPQGFRKGTMEKLHLAHQGVHKGQNKKSPLLDWHGKRHRDNDRQMHAATVQTPARTVHPTSGTCTAMDEGRCRQPYLLLDDCLTKYPEVLNLKTACTVIQKMKSVFTIHGISRELRSDQLTHASPGLPSPNGMAERTMKTVKDALLKGIQTGTDPQN